MELEELGGESLSENEETKKSCLERRVGGKQHSDFSFVVRDADIQDGISIRQLDMQGCSLVQTASNNLGISAGRTCAQEVVVVGAEWKEAEA